MTKIDHKTYDIYVIVSNYIFNENDLLTIHENTLWLDKDAAGEECNILNKKYDKQHVNYIVMTLHEYIFLLKNEWIK